MARRRGPCVGWERRTSSSWRGSDTSTFRCAAQQVACVWSAQRMNSSAERSTRASLRGRIHSESGLPRPPVYQVDGWYRHHGPKPRMKKTSGREKKSVWKTTRRALSHLRTIASDSFIAPHQRSARSW